MSVASTSSATSLSRVRSQNSESQGSTRSRPRPRSPPSMYVAYESNAVKAPKPLLKLDKKPKKTKTSTTPSPVQTRERAFTSPSTAEPPPQRRPSISSFLSLRRKATPASTPSPTTRSLASSSPHDEIPPPIMSNLHETNVHPFDDMPHRHHRPTNKAARMLGKTSSSDARVLVTDFSRPFGRGADKVSLGRHSEESYYSDDGALADDAHIHRQSRLLSPIEFATASRPPSSQFPPEPQQPPDTDDDYGEDVDADVDEWSVPPTPIAPSLPPSVNGARPKTAPSRTPHSHTYASSPPPHSHHQHADSSPNANPYTHARNESTASSINWHNHYSNSPTNTSPVRDSSTSPYMQYRPDTPFLDTLVAMNAAKPQGGGVVAAHGPGFGYAAREVTRKEAKEGWMGEWNQNDMQDVIQKLRSLK
ncbi:hypothetical protein R3P38DRAFT_468804 [Favolaschia claudopus]|uniref:Uncharacterized protein n=1 Tax=Favolaschia claudopus TaxID=2862362 RepID=A0AAV9ZEL9_9AGAR